MWPQTEAEAIRAEGPASCRRSRWKAPARSVSEHAGYDFSKLPARFKLRELENEEIAATQASPVGFVHTMAYEVGGEDRGHARGVLRARDEGERPVTTTPSPELRPRWRIIWKNNSKPPAAAADS